MVLMVGGPPRAGKGIISRRILETSHIPFLSLDVLKMGLHHAVPSVGVEPGAAPAEVGERIWPLVRAMAVNADECGVEYLFEGDMLLPKHVVELERVVGAGFAACFVGYRDIDPQQKLKEIRAHGGLPNDWLTEHDDDYVLEVVEYGIAFSRWLAEECAQVGVRYVDGSADFMAAVDSVVSYLTTEEDC